MTRPILPLTIASLLFLGCATEQKKALGILTEVKPILQAIPVLSSSKIVKVIENNTYTVLEGDTLWSIAGKTYGDPFMWPSISATNSIPEPDCISPGLQLIIFTDVPPDQTPFVWMAKKRKPYHPKPCQ